MTRQINLQRRFQIIEGADLPERKVDQRWDDFESAHAIVMLGPPGSGKTTVFQGLAEANPHGTYKTVRSLLRTPNGELRGSVLYLDALDEARPDRTERDKIDSVIKKLGELGRPSFRISCREADWLGASDLRALKDAVPDKKKLLVVARIAMAVSTRESAVCLHRRPLYLQIEGEGAVGDLARSGSSRAKIYPHPSASVDLL